MLETIRRALVPFLLLIAACPDYQAALAAARQPQRSGRAAWLLSAPQNGVPVGRARPDTTLHVFTEIAGWQLVGETAGQPLGWLSSQSATAHNQ